MKFTNELTYSQYEILRMSFRVPIGTFYNAKWDTGDNEDKLWLIHNHYLKPQNNSWYVPTDKAKLALENRWK